MAADSGELSVFVRRVREFLRSPATTCGAGSSAADVAALMPGTAAVIVVAPDGAPLGIVTDRDLRTKVVAARRDASATLAADVMSAPLVTTEPDAFAFEALLEMTRREIHHLVVLDAGSLVGVVSSDDLLVSQTGHPVTLGKEIARAPSREALGRLAAGVTTLVQRLVDDGGRAGDIARIVAELNDRIVARVLAQAEASLAARGEAPPSTAYCWLVFGSEGRREQTLRTDQDNGLVYADPSPEQAPSDARYYATLAREAIDGLVAVGFPACPGGAMASNPRWCQPLTTWREYFREWMEHPTRDHVLAASMYFDLRPIVGARALGDSLTEIVRSEAPAQRRFLTAMARDVVDRGLPTTLWGGIRVHRSGPHRGAVDVKGAGGIQLVGAARVHALELGLAETGTAERFLAAGARGLCTPEDATVSVDAYEDLVRLRLLHQLACLREGRPPDNYVDPHRLSHRDQLLLRDALKTAGHVQAMLRERFATDFAP